MMTGKVVNLASYRPRPNNSSAVADDPPCEIRIGATLPVSVVVTLIDFLNREGCSDLADHLLNTSWVYDEAEG